MKRLIILLLLTTSIPSIAQETLDLRTHAECELFKEKKDFDREERLQEIKDLRGTDVTVYLVKGKKNKIKSSYTGFVDLKLIEHGASNLKNATSVLLVTEDKGSGQMTTHFPLTDVNYFRIYRTDCLKD